MQRRLATALVVLSIVGDARAARAGEDTLPEPVIQENITDIDALDVGSLELDLTPRYVRAQHSSSGLWATGLEAEWRPIDRVGIGGEVEVSGELDASKFLAPAHVVPRASASFVFLRDFERKVFLQAEAGGRYDGPGELAQLDPTELVLPYWAGIRGAAVAGPADLRLSALAEAGRSFVHAPLNTGAALLLPFAGSAKAAVGVEALADWARRYPLLLAPQAQLLTHAAGRPVRLQVAFPVTAGAKGADATYGISFRFVLEPDE